MKKQILRFALVATMIGCIAAGCSSEKKAGGTDSTSVKDSSPMSAPAMKDSTMKDSTKKDSTKTPPKM